jgi:hypothetical protein
MASEAQILANRKNAQKSTGPRTEEGKAVASQNAVKHGLLARRSVISSEDPEEFDAFREQMLGELAPAGPMETVLAERIVSLSWRLKRAERMQDEALDCLLAEDSDGSPGDSGELGSFEQAGGPEGGESALGRVVVKDFAKERTLERLMIYERRIENSLYKTMSELDRMKLLKPLDARERERYREQACHDPRFTGGSLPRDPRFLTPVPSPGQPSCKTNPISAGPGTWQPHGDSAGTALGLRENSPRLTELAQPATGGG